MSFRPLRPALALAVALLPTSGALLGQQSPALPDAPPIPVSPETRALAAQLVGDIAVNGQAYEYDRQLADTIGPRLTGSANYMRAAKWAESHFRELGLSNVHTEDWTIPATWEPDPDHPPVGRLTAPVDHPLHLYSVGWSPSTPKSGVTGAIVYISSFSPSSLDATLPRLKGAVALIDRGSAGPKATEELYVNALHRILSSGAVGLLTTGIRNGAETLSATSDDATLAPIPEAQVGLEDSLLIKRLLEHGPVTVSFALTNRTRKDVRVPNVLAELPGSDPSLPVVMIGAHLDSWQPGTGAQDNGTGTATVLEAARALKALPHPPLRTIRFALFGGEEQGLLGSTAWARAHQSEISSIDAILISDTGAEAARGWYLMGRDDEASALKNVEPVLAGIGADKTNTSTHFIFSTDHAALDVLGVPSLVLWTGVDTYDTLHHKASDTFDSVVQKDLNQGVTVTAVTALALAESRQPFAPHISPEQVGEMLKQHENLDDYRFLKSTGLLP